MYHIETKRGSVPILYVRKDLNDTTDVPLALSSLPGLPGWCGSLLVWGV